MVSDFPLLSTPPLRSVAIVDGESVYTSAWYVNSSKTSDWFIAKKHNILYNLV